MTVEDISQDALRAMYAQQADEVLLTCLAISHPSLPHPIRVVNDAVPLIVGSDTVADMTGNGHDAALVGQPTWVRGLVQGGVGAAVRLSAASQAISAPAVDLGTAWTVEVVVRADALVDGMALVAGGMLVTGAADGGVTLEWPDSGLVMRSLATGPGRVRSSRIVHVAVRHDDTTTEIVVDGEVVAAEHGFDSASIAAPLTIGNVAAGDNPFPGSICEVRCWDRLRSLKELQDDQARMINAKQPGLVAYFPMNDGAYLPFPFDLVLPDDMENEQPQVTLTIDNVDRTIVRTLRSLPGDEPIVTISTVLASSPDVIEHGPFEMLLKDASYDALVVTGTLTFGGVDDARYPKDEMTPLNCPGLF